MYAPHVRCNRKCKFPLFFFFIINKPLWSFLNKNHQQLYFILFPWMSANFRDCSNHCWLVELLHGNSTGIIGWFDKALVRQLPDRIWINVLSCTDKIDTYNSTTTKLCVIFCLYLRIVVPLLNLSRLIANVQFNGNRTPPGRDCFEAQVFVGHYSVLLGVSKQLAVCSEIAGTTAKEHTFLDSVGVQAFGRLCVSDLCENKTSK